MRTKYHAGAAHRTTAPTRPARKLALAAVVLAAGLLYWFWAADAGWLGEQPSAAVQAIGPDGRAMVPGSAPGGGKWEASPFARLDCAASPDASGQNPACSAIPLPAEEASTEDTPQSNLSQRQKSLLQLSGNYAEGMASIERELSDCFDPDIQPGHKYDCQPAALTALRKSVQAAIAQLPGAAERQQATLGWLETEWKMAESHRYTYAMALRAEAVAGKEPDLQEVAQRKQLSADVQAAKTRLGAYIESTLPHDPRAKGLLRQIRDLPWEDTGFYFRMSLRATPAAPSAVRPHYERGPTMRT